MRKQEEPLIFRGNTKNFSEAEFYCKCGCGAYNMREPFIARLQSARTQAGIPMIIEAGCMCAKQAAREETLGKNLWPYTHPDRRESPCTLAAHMSGHAAKISADPDTLARYEKNVTAAEIFGLIVPALLEAEFKHIGIYFDQKLIHVDDANWHKNRPVVIWGS